MPASPQDLYNPVPTVAPETSSGNNTLSVRATPEAMGAELGSAVQRAGQTGVDTGQKVVDYARFQQGLVNETLTTRADADFATKVGEIKAKYNTLTGMAAYGAFPQYQEDIKSAFNQSRSQLPPMAQRGFDMMAARSMANHIADGSSYAASQLKEDQRDSYASLANAQFTALLDPNVASDPRRSGEALGTLKYASEAQIDPQHPGLKTDPKTGITSFDESTPEGQNLKMGVEQRTQAYLTQGYVNRYRTLMSFDLFGAHEQYQQERDDMPAGARVMLDATFKPKIFDAHVNGASGNALQDAFHGHWQALINPSSAGSNAYNLGNVKTASGAANNTQDFMAPATPVDGVVLTANNLRGKNYTGKTLEEIGRTWTSTDPDAWVKNVSSVSGIDPKTVPDLNDPATLNKLLTGIATAEKSPKDRAIFTPDVIDQGVQASLGGHQPATTQTPNKQTYGTNENGAPLTVADYYMQHKQDILTKGDAYAESLMPGDLALKRSVRQSLSNFMETTIQNQHAQVSMDNREIMRAINGEKTNGKVPGTELELRQIPGMSDLLDKAAYQDPKFSETIPTLVAKSSSRHSTTNSANGFDTMMRTLEPNDGLHPNGIFSQDHLDRLLGRSDGTGINIKDYKEAKQAIELPDKFKSFLTKNMQAIATANGNVDGMGQQRAVNYYNSAMEVYQKKLQDGKTVANMTNPENSDYINLHGDFMPSRASQLQTTAQRTREGTPTYVEGQTATGPNGQKITYRNGTWQ